MKHTKTYNEEYECFDHLIELDLHFDLGNNYQYRHFIAEVIKHEDLVDYLKTTDITLEDGVYLQAEGNYGLVGLNTCGNDLFDHLRGY